MPINLVVQQIINDSVAEARHICGSEGLYQCIIYNNARNHPAVNDVEREYKIRLKDGKVGYLDFVLTVEDVKYAIELKAGANSYRNSLEKAKEVDNKYGSSKTGGILKDFEKLRAFIESNDVRKHKSIQVCLETAYIRNGFDSTDVKSYSTLAIDKSICFVYGTEGPSGESRWVVGNKQDVTRFSELQITQGAEPSKFDIDTLDWVSYFKEIELASPKDEKFSQGNLYYYLRKLGLSERQCANEVFFHFAKKPNTRASYWLPDIAVFDKDFNGRFNLGVDNSEKKQNDHEKLKSLCAIIEIKGSKVFKKLSVEKKIGLINNDLDKLYCKLNPAITSKLRSEGIDRAEPIQLIMVIADSDPDLKDFIRDAENAFQNKIKIFWSGDYT